MLKYENFIYKIFTIALVGILYYTFTVDYFNNSFSFNMGFWKNILLLVLFFLAITILFRFSDEIVTDSAKLIFSASYIGIPFSISLIIPTSNNPLTPEIFYIFLLIWISDTFAFLVGSKFGKRKLAPKISPNKSVEGLIGGILFTIVAGFIIEYFYSDLQGNWIVISIIIAIFAPIGDLAESKLKRMFSVKDSGNIMPGHGGILDRLDSFYLLYSGYICLLFNFNDNMRFHREGNTIMTVSIILFFAISSLSLYSLNYWGLIIVIPALIILSLIVWFFRNPIREYQAKPEEIIAPVDGKVVIVKEVYEKEYLKNQCLQVSIFMSPLNVHVCRYPVGGKVIFKKYHPGKFLVAWHEKSSELNERTTVVVEAENNQKVLFRQIAGALARRIVYYPEIGDIAQAGKEFGFIKFGSRMDVFLPLGTEILVKVGDIIPDGGERVIACLKS